MTIIEYREARPEDLLDIEAISTYFRSRFLHDYEELVPETFTPERLVEDFTIVFTMPLQGSEDQDELPGLPKRTNRSPIAAASFSDINLDLSAVLHFIIRPAYLRTFLREKSYLDALLDRFRAIKVQSLIVEAYGFNKVSQKLAERMGFQHVGTIHKQVYYQDKVYDTLIYQLDRKDLAKQLREQFLAEVDPDCRDQVIEMPKRKQRHRKPKGGLIPVATTSFTVDQNGNHQAQLELNSVE